MVKGKRGQLKIQQMAFMLIGVTILFALAGMFFLAIYFGNLQKTATDLEEENSLLLVSRLANSPEFSCGNSFGENRINCVDFEKTMILGLLEDDYSDFWGVAKIEIRKIYPSGDEVCDFSNYPDCNIIEILDKDVNTLPSVSNYVSLCRKETNGAMIYDKCELAMLIVSSEDKT